MATPDDTLTPTPAPVAGTSTPSQPAQLRALVERVDDQVARALLVLARTLEHGS